MASGHIHKREGRRGTTYAFVVELERDPATGKRRQKWVSGFRTKEAAHVAMRAKLKTLDDGEDPFPPEITVRSFVLDRWLPHLETQGRVRERTVASYRQLWTDHTFEAIGALEIRKVRVAHVQAVLDAMTEKGKAPRTVAHARAAMSAAFRQAVRWQLVTTNVVRDSEAPQKQAPELRIPTAPELHKIIEAARGTEWETAILLSAATGARRGEVLGLRWGNVDLDRGRVRISEALAQSGEYSEPKSEKSKRTIPVPSWAVERLRAHRTAQAQRLLALGVIRGDQTPVCDDGGGDPLDPNRFTKAAKEICSAAGVAGARLHDLRHGVVTALANAGDLAQASEIAGHSSLAFTHATYVHADDARIERNGEALERALGGAG